MSERETEPGPRLRWGPEVVQLGTGRTRELGMIASMMVTVLSSHLQVLEEEEDSFYGEAPPLLEREQVWGQILSLVLLPD